MDRIDKGKMKFKTLFERTEDSLSSTDPDFVGIRDSFVYGEVAYQGNLSDRLRVLINLVILTTNLNLEHVGEHVSAALNAGATPVDIKETLYQCAPYIGFPKTESAVRKANEVFVAKGVSLPVESQKQVSEETRLEKGLKIQKSIFGEVIDQMRQSAPAKLIHIQDYLSAYCFGDIYTRSGLDLKTREILTLCILITLGGCESQVKSHMIGNVSVGNDKDTLIAVITQCLPLIGFPRTLNALGCLNEVIPG